MPVGQLYINGVDAFETYGISLAPDSLSLLMTPPSMKDFIENESNLEDGKRVIVSDSPKVASREITLIVNISATTVEQFLLRYAAFCENVLMGTTLTISTSFQPGVVYHMLYQSCQNFSQYHLGVGKFSLKLLEPNPKNRT